MKESRILIIRTATLLSLVLVAFSSIFAQEGVSRKVVFRLNNAPDEAPPTISIISPALVAGQSFVTHESSLDLMGEVKDDSKIRFVAINTDIKPLNETGVFAQNVKLLPGENRIVVKSMDEHNNMQELVYLVKYEPPVITLEDKIMQNSKYHALLIGIDDYEDPGFLDLDNPVKDARRLYYSLTENYTFNTENVTVLENPTRSEIFIELDQLRKKVKENDNLLIFYAGHGYWDDDAGVGYWLPSDATMNTTADWFRNSALVDYLQAIHSKHTLLITDACFAGSIFKSRSIKLDKELIYEKIYEKPSRKAMTSGALSEVPDKSAFVKYLVKSLDENQEKYLSSQELFNNFQMAVISNSSADVLPQYGEIQNVGNEGGDFIFLKRDE